MPSMELEDDEKYDSIPIEAVKPDFPYGLRICLTDKEFAKMGANPEELNTGDLVHLTECFARVMNVHHDDGPMGKTCRVELQIEHCNIEDETAEDDEG